MTKKDVKKTREQANPKVCMHLSSRETAVLDAMMKKEGWQNVSGFIKNKVFGDSVDYKYERISKAKEKENSITILKENFYNLTDKINDMNSLLDSNMEKFYKRLEESEMDADFIQKVRSSLERWICAIKTISEKYISNAETILNRIHIPMETTKPEDDSRISSNRIIEKQENSNE